MTMRMPLLLLAAACVAGCSTPPSSSTPMPSTGNSVPSKPPSISDALIAQHWHLREARNAQGKAITALQNKPGAPLQVDFDDGQMRVRGGCNALGAAYRLDGDRLMVGDFVSTLMACADQRLMQADREAGARLRGELKLSIDAERLRITNATGDVLVLAGEPTAQTRFGGTGERVFLEVAAQTRACSHPLIPDKRCLQVRELHYDANGLKIGNPGEFRAFYDNIEGYVHQPGVRNVLRVKRFERAHPPADASRYAWVLGMVVEADTSGR